MKAEVYPLERVIINGISIDFGMKKEVVESMIGKGEFVGQRYYYFNNEMAIQYNVSSTNAKLLIKIVFFII